MIKWLKSITKSIKKSGPIKDITNKYKCISHLNRPQDNSTKDQNQWTLAVQKKPRRETVETSYRNPETEVIISRNHRSKGQTKDFNKRRHLSKLHNSNNGSRKELV